MDLVRDTPLEHGVIFWPMHPPRASMLVVVKATFALTPDGVSPLASEQVPPTGELYQDDDPERSLRHPNDYALLKPRGECFVVGSCRPLTGRPEERTVAAFRIGAITKSFAVHGDRRWDGSSISRPVPFTEMPLSWERAFGGAGHDANPMGRGLAADANGLTWLPNVEREGAPITAKDARPEPACASPIAMSCRARRRFAGTYDDAWRAERYPWYPKDFRYAFFNEAPEDQQIDGYWSGGEAIALTHLHPAHPRVSTRLPRLLPRAFVERDEGAFEEIGLVCDTITIDADRGLAYAVWRGTLPLTHDALEPLGLARLFVMHEEMDHANAVASSVEACRARMEARLAADRAAQLDLHAVEPPPHDDDPDATITDGASVARVAEVGAAHAEAVARATAAMGDRDPLAELEAKMKEAGFDIAALLREVEDPARAPEAMGPPDLDALRSAFAALGQEAPDLQLLEDALAHAQRPPEPVTPPRAPPKPDLRELVVDAHRHRKPLRGDFTGANLSGLDLSGLDARDAILIDAGFRGAKLRGAKLDGANLTRADFLSADLTDATIRKADLTGAVLEDAKLVNAKLDDATLEGAELMHAVLDDASLKGADLTGAQLSGASFVGAVCDRAMFTGARMDACRFTAASLVEARLYGVIATELVLDRADLTQIRVGRGADLSKSTVRNAKAEGSSWRDAILVGVSFAGTPLGGADFTRANLTSASLGGCPMRRAVFQESVLSGASLKDADVYEGSFQAARLDGTDLAGANLFRANFFRAYGRDASLAGANLDGTMWETRR